MKKKLLRIMLVAGCLYATACTLNRETIVPGAEVEGEEVAVTFLLSAEDQMVSSRAEGTQYEKRNISKGLLIDKVIYAVYVKTNEDNEDNEANEDNGGFRLLMQYGDGTEGLGDGQARLTLTENFLTEGETLTLRLMRGQEYVIGFWAQNSGCTAYDTEDLTRVIVNYKADWDSDALASNNDEVRDAFCQVSDFVAEVGVSETVVLKRAMAQINVGTSGWDYNNEVDYGNSYAYSKIEMTGLKNKLNVLTGDVTKTDDFDGTVVYDWAVLPAYIDMEKGGKLTPYSNEDNSAAFAKWLKDKENDKERLYVKLVDDDSKYLDYLEEEPEETKTEISTEIFKYLSMCYVLAPTAPYTAGSNTSGIAIDKLTFYLAEFIEDGEGYVYDDAAKKLSEKAPVRFELENVPIQRNWRTNILGGLRGGTDNSLFDPRAIALWIDLSPSYDDEHFHYDSGTGKSEDDEDCTNDHDHDPDHDPWVESKEEK